MDEPDRAKIFWSGRSQAVRLPKEYRFDATEVRIRRQGSAVILEPIPTDWSWLEEIVGAGVDDDFVAAVEEEVEEQEREGLDHLFD